MGQRRSPDPLAANRAEDPGFDGRFLIGRPVLKWFSEVTAWFGGWVSAARPPDPDLSDSRWLFTVKYEDDDCEDLELEELRAIIQPADPPNHVHLYRTSEWKKLRKLYEDVRASLDAGYFDGSSRACIGKLFHFKQLNSVTRVSVMKKFRELQRRIHSDKTTREPPQVHHLARLLFYSDESPQRDILRFQISD